MRGTAAAEQVCGLRSAGSEDHLRETAVEQECRIAGGQVCVCVCRSSSLEGHLRDTAVEQECRRTGVCVCVGVGVEGGRCGASTRGPRLG